MSYNIVRRCAAMAAALVAVAFVPSHGIAQDHAAAAEAADTAGTVVQAGAAVSDSVRVDSAAAFATPLLRPAVLDMGDLALAAGFTAAAVALMPFDRAVTGWVRSDQHLENDVMRRTFAGAEWGVEKGALVASAGLYGAGLLTRNRTLAGIGAHTLVSVGVTHQVTQLLKGVFGRSRPYYSADSLPNDWQWGSGFGDSDRRSFPSGHTSTAFAFATAMSTEISHAWPRAGRIATPLLYAGATGAAIARIYHDQHWASDVTLGAAVGILSTRATLRLLHGHPGNLLDKVLLNTSIVPANGGLSFAFSIPTP